MATTMLQLCMNYFHVTQPPSITEGADKFLISVVAWNSTVLVVKPL